MGIPDKVERPIRDFCFIVLSRKKYLYGNLKRIRKTDKEKKGPSSDLQKHWGCAVGLPLLMFL